jgi:hypothetical protein
MSRRPVITDLESSVSAGHSRAACRNRTEGLFITSDHMRRLVSVSVGRCAADLRISGLAVGRSRMPLAPRRLPYTSLAWLTTVTGLSSVRAIVSKIMRTAR